MREDHRVIPCALCGGTDTRHLYTKFDLGIERCRRCNLVYANPRGAEAIILSRYTAEYFCNEYLPSAGAPGGTVDFTFVDGRHRPLLGLIRRHAPDARRLLDGALDKKRSYKDVDSLLHAVYEKTHGE